MQQDSIDVNFVLPVLLMLLTTKQQLEEYWTKLKLYYLTIVFEQFC